MDDLIVFTAEYLHYLIVLAGVVVWLLVPRRDKVALLVQGAVTVVILVVLIVVAGALHTNPRPFVADPSVQPLFAHDPDNGFPSNHTSFAVAVGLLVSLYWRKTGALLAVLGVCVGAARVAAHVHHTQDIVAGAVIGLIAVAVAWLVWRVLAPTVLGWAERVRLVPAPTEDRDRVG